MNQRAVGRIIAWALFFVGGYVVGTSSLINEPNSSEADSQSVDVLADTLEDTDSGIPPRKLSPSEQATINLFEEAAPSVAFINTSNFRSNYWTRDITEIPRGSGSGFVWDKQGHIVTNYHVIENADKATVTLSDQSSWEADLVGVAREKDLAILKIKAPAQILFPIDVGVSRDLMVGQTVLAIGNPFGLDQTLTTGVISALGREITSKTGTPIRDVIQTDAAINPGNSGGPLLDTQGKLIGVNTAIYSPSGAYAGIGFSIPVDEVNWVVSDLIKYGSIRRPTLGVELFPQSNVSRAGLEGAVVYNVVPGGAADKAGMRPTRRSNRGDILLGDIIIGIDDQKVSNTGELSLALEKYKAGDTIRVHIIRGKKELVLDLTLDKEK